MKIITHVLVHGKMSGTNASKRVMKLIAYNEDVERLSHICAILQTSGMCNCYFQRVNVVSSKDKPGQGASTPEVIVEI